MKSKRYTLDFLIVISLVFTSLIGQEAHDAVRAGKIDQVRSMLNDQPELLESRDEDNRTLLMCAAIEGHVDIIRFLIHRGADIRAGDREGSQGIHLAAIGGHQHAIELFTEAGVDVNETDDNGMTPLHFAASRSQEECSLYLLTVGADADAREINGRTVLFFVARSGNMQLCRALVHAGADVNVLNNYRRSPLLYAVWGNHLPVVDYLLLKGAHVDVIDTTGYTPLHYVCMEGQVDMVERFLKKSSRLRLRDQSGREPIHLAANRGFTDVLALLIDQGVEIDARDSAGDTPLHGLAWKGDQKGVEFLISQGADVNIRNDRGRTPIDYSILAGYRDVEQSLRRADAVANRESSEKSRNLNSNHDEDSILERVRMTVLYDNYSAIDGVRSEWGFSCLIEGTEKTILFDTGGDAEILMHNIDYLNVDLKQVDLIVITHNHWDHTGGLSAVLKRRPGLPVYAPKAFPYDFVRDVEKAGGRVVPVDESMQICEGVYTTGPMGDRLIEQSLIVDHHKGNIIVTGCSHQGIVSILEKAKAMMNKDLYLVFGGFHLMQHTDAQVQSIIERFEQLGVKKCGATHCTGDRQIGLFKKAFGEQYVPIGTGRVLSFTKEGLQ